MGFEASRPKVPAIYGLKKDSPLLPWSYVSDRMAAAKHYWLVTMSASGWADARPIDGIWLDEKFWFGGSPEARWRRNLQHDPRATVHLEDAEAAVMLQGLVRETKADPELATRLADASNEKYGYGQTADDWQSEAFLVFQPERGLAWKVLFEDATRWVLA